MHISTIQEMLQLQGLPLELILFRHPQQKNVSYLQRQAVVKAQGQSVC